MNFVFLGHGHRSLSQCVIVAAKAEVLCAAVRLMVTDSLLPYAFCDLMANQMLAPLGKSSSHGSKGDRGDKSDNMQQIVAALAALSFCNTLSLGCLRFNCETIHHKINVDNDNMVYTTYIGFIKQSFNIFWSIQST